MSRLIRRLLLLIIISSSILVSSFHVAAFEAKEHDKYYEKVLFGANEFKQKKNDYKDIIQSLEYASYLAIDQFMAEQHPNDQVKLDYLKKRRISKVPKIEDIDFDDVKNHRSYTHRGWDFDYSTLGKVKKNWETRWEARKNLLINTVNKELDIPYTGFLWFKTYSEIGESFAAITYYVHILGDFIDAEWHEKDPYVQMIHFADKNDEDNSLIEELIKHMDVVFADQKGTHTYPSFKSKIRKIGDKAWGVLSSQGGLNTKEKFNTVHDCAIELMDLLIAKMPDYLKKESFFADVFYND